MVSCATGEKRVLAFEKGEKVVFPVPRDHRYACFQTVAPIASVEDISRFVDLWSARAMARGRPFPEPEAVCNALRSENFHVMVLAADDVVIPAGTIVILNNLLNRLRFAHVDIKGDLVCRGNLVAECAGLSEGFEEDGRQR